MDNITKRFCPKCHSENIILWMGGYTGAMYRCPDCGYIGPIVIETNDPIPSSKCEADGEYVNYSDREE